MKNKMKTYNLSTLREMTDKYLEDAMGRTTFNSLQVCAGELALAGVKVHLRTREEKRDALVEAGVMRLWEACRKQGLTLLRSESEPAVFTISLDGRNLCHGRELGGKLSRLWWGR